MLRRFQCTNCGEHGWVLSDEPTVAPLCSSCAHRVEVERPDFGSFPSESSAIDDKVVSWLSEPPLAPRRTFDAVATCVACGFEGLMQYGAPRGDTICPACLEVYRTRPERARRLVDCPNCCHSIEVREIDRGKTIVCPECKYFLGCMLLPEKRRFAALPFLNVLLGVAKD